MPFDIEDVTDRVSEIADIAHTGEISAADAQSLADLGNKITESLKSEVPTIEFKGAFDVDGKTVKFTIGDGTSTPKEITVRTADGRTMNYADALSDPTVDPADVTNGFKAACEAVGLSFPNDLADQMTERVANNPQRSLNEAGQQVDTRAAKPDIKADIAGDETLNANDKAYDLAKENKALRDKIAAQQDEILKSKSVMKDVQANMDKINEKLKDMSDSQKKSFTDKLKEGSWSATKFLALLGAGYLTYELIKGYQNELKGCWQGTSTGSSVSKGKIWALTCDSCCNSSGDSSALLTVCDPTAVQPPSPIPPCVDCHGDPSCKIGSSCDSSETGLCSVWCRNSVRVLKDKNGNSNSYQCNDPSFADTIADIAGNVDNAISNLFGDITSFLHNLLKYGLYAVIVIIGLVLLYLAYKFISPIFSKHNTQQSEH